MTDRISWCKTVFLIIAVCMGLVSRAESTPVKENTAGLTETMTARYGDFLLLEEAPEAAQTMDQTGGEQPGEYIWTSDDSEIAIVCLEEGCWKAWATGTGITFLRRKQLSGDLAGEVTDRVIELTVEKRPLLIAAGGPLSKEYGTVTPEIAVSAKGFADWDAGNEEFLKTLEFPKAQAEAESKWMLPGVYPISYSGGRAPEHYFYTYPDGQQEDIPCFTVYEADIAYEISHTGLWQGQIWTNEGQAFITAKEPGARIALSFSAKDRPDESWEEERWVDGSSGVKIELPKEGTVLLGFYLQNEGGGVSARIEQTVYIDRKAPVAKIRYENVGRSSDGIYTASPAELKAAGTDAVRTAHITIKEENFDPALAEVRLWAEDGSGGAVELPDTMRRGEWKESEAGYEQVIAFTLDAKYSLELTGTDKAGNPVDTSSFLPEDCEFIIDTEAPERLEIVSPQPDCDMRTMYPDADLQLYALYGDSITLELSAYDRTAGIAEFFCKFDGRDLHGPVHWEKKIAAQRTPDGSYTGTLLIEEGQMGRAEVRALDRAGYYIEEQSGYLIIDGRVPGPPKADTNGYVPGTWTKEDVLVSVQDSASLAGISGYEYTVAEGELTGLEEWHPMTKEQSVREEQTEMLLRAHACKGDVAIGTDTNLIYYFRGVSNLGIPGEPSEGLAVKVQKTLPVNVSLDLAPPGERGWYTKIPDITIKPAQRPARACPAKVFCRIWELNTKQEDGGRVWEPEQNRIELPGDGEFGLTVWTADEAGNRSHPSEDIRLEVRIDTVPPKAGFYYDGGEARNGSYYARQGRLTVWVTDQNFSQGDVLFEIGIVKGTRPGENGWIQEGMTWKKEVLLTQDGEYDVRISGTDLAGNAMIPLEQVFAVDTTAPTIKVSGVSEWMSSSSPVEVSLEVEEDHPDRYARRAVIKGLVNGTALRAGEWRQVEGREICTFGTFDQDDRYLLEYTACDLAGNRTEKSLLFTVNQSGTSFFLEQNPQGTYLNHRFQPKIRMTNLDEITVLSFLVNGQSAPYRYEGNVLWPEQDFHRDGKYRVMLEVCDTAGNTDSMDPLEFIIDTSAPVVQIDGVEDGGRYPDGASVRIYKDKTADIWDYVSVNGAVLDPPAYQIGEDGVIRLEIRESGVCRLSAGACDYAGNKGCMEAVIYIGRPDMRRWVVFAGGALILLLLGAAALFGIKARTRRQARKTRPNP